MDFVTRTTRPDPTRPDPAGRHGESIRLVARSALILDSSLPVILDTPALRDLDTDLLELGGDAILVLQASIARVIVGGIPCVSRDEK